jgi:lipooligosaccharide transport system ATP-binding protein
MNVIVRARNLVKRYGDFTAVDGISFDICAGECFGLLGPNGAGKTTTTRMITCVSPVTAGELTVDGLDVRHEPRRIKSFVGVVPQEDNLDPTSRCAKPGGLRALLRHAPRLAEAHRRACFFSSSTNSTGRWAVHRPQEALASRGIISQPKILVLDEPTTGFGPATWWPKLRYLQPGQMSRLLEEDPPLRPAGHHAPGAYPGGGHA